jgi:excisionase family DNA binding protein
MSSADPRELLTEKDAARVLSLSNRTLQTWRVRGAGPPFVRAGRAVRYRRSDLDEWVSTQTVHSGSVSSQTSRGSACP